MILAPPERERRAATVRVSVMFAAIFFVTGNSVPYLPVWLAWRQLTAPEIAIISACPLFVRVLLTPLIAFAADRRGDHRRVLILLAWAAVGSQLLLARSEGFYPILLACLLLAVAWTSITPLAEAIAVEAMRAVRLDYGRMRLWGSISFTAAALAGGWLIEHRSPQALFWLLIGGSIVLAGAAHRLAGPAPASRPHRPRAGARLSVRAVAALLGSRQFLLLLLAAGAIQAAHAAFYTFGTLHWSALGISTLVAGQLWTVGIAAEILVFAYSAALIRHVGPSALLVIAAGSAVTRWTAMAFDPPVWLLYALQTLHGLTFGATHVGTIHALTRLAPPTQGGTAQALYAAVASGILLGGATLVAGPLYAAYGAGAYLAMAMLAAIGFFAALGLARMPEPAAGPGRLAASRPAEDLDA
jgi:MFS transporter, PPP family, 3-phenylpropionic acid transporter